MTRISVVIPTYNRPGDLAACMDCIAVQTVLPHEIIVVDNGRDSASEAVVLVKRDVFDRLKIGIRYLRNSRNSLTVARNIGAENAHGDVILFADDDVRLDSKYIESITETFGANPSILGVQGYIRPGRRPWVREWFNCFFFWYHLEHDRCRVLASVSATYPVELDRIIQCQWMSGANHAFRKSVFAEFRYDENLLKYCDGEDLEFSYRVHSRYPGALWITPRARAVHLTSMTARSLGKELVFMQEVYGVYLFYKLFPPSLTNRAIFIWSRVGRLLEYLLRAGCQPSRESVLAIYHLLMAYRLALLNREKLRTGNLEFFNNTLS